jgi:hypothetical protein
MILWRFAADEYSEDIFPPNCADDGASNVEHGVQGEQGDRVALFEAAGCLEI